MAMVVHDKDCKRETLPNGVVRIIRGHIPDLMVVELHWKKGMEGAPHQHPHRQGGYVIKGSFEGVINGKKETLTAGDIYYTGKDEVHGLVALEDDSILLDIFTPRRDDFLA